MALSNRPQKSLYQIGDTVYFLNGKKMEEGTVKKVITGVTNPLADSTGVQEDIYFIGDLVQSFKEKELFHSKNALLFDLKEDWLNQIEEIAFEGVNFQFIGSDFSYSYFKNAHFDRCIVENVKFDGSYLRSALFKGLELLGSSFRNSNLRNAAFTDSDISASDFRGADLNGAILPSNANTKSTFKTVVGAGHWDPVTTIWIDGQPIGN